MATFDFNPREVLDHLHELGYTNITADQLKEFIKDLKKLIKYDQRMKGSKRQTEGNQIGEEDSDDDDDDVEQDNTKLKVPNPTPRRMLSPLTAELAGDNMRRRNNPNSRLDRDDTLSNSQSTNSHCINSEVDSKRVLRPVPESRPDQRVRLNSETKSETTKSQASTSRACSAKENVQPPRSRSFIRPWKYQPAGQKPGFLSNRCDPVTLYHKYQALWQQNKIPGEETHSGLRWNIRERMLGQDPHPRPVSQASSLESMNRRGVSRM